MTDQAKKKALNKHFSEVLCPGCGQAIRESDDMSRIQYVRTKRATDVFFHTECFRRIWNRREKNGKRLIDANALDDEVTNFFLAITGNPKQTTVVRECKESFRRMIDEQPTVYANNGWIPVSEKLPEVGKMVKVTVHSSGWIADYDSAWVPEEEKTYHSEEYGVYDGYLSRAGKWRFYDDQYSENTCVKEFGTDKGTVYDVVTAWMPKEQIEPYKEE